MELFFLSILSYKNAPIIITLSAVAICMVFFGFLVYRFMKAKVDQENFERQLKYIASPGAAVHDDYTEKSNFFTYWGKLLKEGDIINRNHSDAKVGIVLTLSMFLLFIVFTIVFGNPGIGLIPAFFIPILLRVLAGAKIKARKKKIDDQIPGFISALKSNTQSNATPERALIDAIDTTSSPLYDELAMTKAHANTSNFTIALDRLRRTTSSKDIRFLCSCIQISAEYGSNLEQQLEKIEQIVAERRELIRKLDKAASEQNPLIYVVIALLPVVFFTVYSTNEFARNWWFKDPASWVVFIVLIGIFLGSIIATRRVISKLDDLR